MNTSQISLLSSSPRDELKIDSTSSIFHRMLEKAGDNHEFLFRELISKSSSFDEHAPTHEYMEEFYKVLEHVLRESPKLVFSDKELEGLRQILRFTPSTLLNKKIFLIEHLTHYLLSESFIKQKKKDEEGVRIYFPLEEGETTRLPAKLWSCCLLPAMHYCRILIDMAPEEERKRFAVLASSLLYRFIDFEIIESGYFDHEMSSQDQILFLSQSRIEHPSINKKIYEDLKTELDEHNELKLKSRNDFAANLPRRILEDYPAGLRHCREQVVSTFLRAGCSIPRPDEIRGKQREVTRVFWNFFTDTFLADAFNILGPAPCSYAIVPSGSFGCEEVTSLSNLKCFILIEDFSKIEYFNKLVRLIKLLVVSLGETKVNVPILPSWMIFRTNGFHINYTSEEYIIPLNQPDFILKWQEAADVAEEPFSDYSLFKLPFKLVSDNEGLLRTYLNSIRSHLRTPLPISATHYTTFGERIAYHNIKRRIRKHRKHSSSSISTDSFDIKANIIGPLTHLLTDLHLYFRDSSHSVASSSSGEETLHPLTNTLDLIDDLEEVFDSESRELLKQCVSQLYLIRVRLHHAYGVDQSLQKDLAIIDRSDLKVKRLFDGEKELVDRTLWLVLNPLYDFIEETLKKTVPFREAMREISLKNVMLADLDKRLLLVKDLQEKIDYDEDLSKKMKKQYRKETRESFHQLVEICSELSRYLLETNAPIEQHDCIYRLFSTDPAFERLRIAYLKKLEHHQLHAHLARIPNRDGRRQSTRLDEEKFESNLLKIIQNTPPHGSVTCKVTSPTLKEGFYLTQEVINAILAPNGELKNETTGVDRDGCRYQRGMVDLSFRKTFQPLTEYAIYALLSRMMGKGSPVTELARFEVTVSGKKKVYPVLITETIHGTNLKDVLTHYPFPIDRYHLTLMQLCTLLIRPGNGQALNHVLTPQNQIYCTKNEISFVEPLGNSRKRLGLSIGRKLNFCSILFCLNEPLDQAALREFATLDAPSILTALLEDIEKRRELYLTLFNPKEREILYTRDPKHLFTPTLMLSKQELHRLFLQFRYLQEYIRQAIYKPSPACSQNSSFSLNSSRNSEIDDLDFVLIEGNPQHASSSSSSIGNITSLDLLEQMITLVENDEIRPIGMELRTAYSLAMRENLEMRLNKATNAGSKAMTPAEAYKASLGYVPTLEALEALEIENGRSISQAKKELPVYTLLDQKAWTRIGKSIVVELNFSAWKDDSKKQEEVLEKFLGMLNEREEKPTTIVLTDCQVLTDRMLPSLLSSQLKVLNLTGCSRFFTISSIATLSPNLKKLDLSRCSGFGSRVMGYMASLLSDQKEKYETAYYATACFPELEELRIEHCSSLSRINLHSNFLKVLEINDNPELEELSLNLIFPIPEVIVDNCPRLNPNWNKKVPYIYKRTPTTTIGGINERILLKLIENDRSVTELNLSDCKIDDTSARILARALTYNSHLRKLDLGNNQIGDIGAMALATALEANSTLTKLYLNGNQIGIAGATALAKAIEQNSHLITFDLSNNQIGDIGAMAFAMAIEYNSTLIRLYLNKNQISNTGATALAMALTHNSTLTVFTLSRNQISYKGATALAAAFLYNSVITVLNLSNNQIGDEGAIILGKAFENNSRLKSLALSQNQIGDKGVAAIAKAFGPRSSLRSLVLSKNQIGNEGATALAMVFGQDTKLSSLDLSKNQIGDEGAVALATFVDSSTLTALYLNSNQIGDAGALRLARALDNNSTLTKLYLSNNLIGDDGIVVLAGIFEHKWTLEELVVEKNPVSEAVLAAFAQAVFYRSSLKNEIKKGDLLTEFDLDESEIDVFYRAFVQGLERRALEHHTSVVKLCKNDNGIAGDRDASIKKLVKADFYPYLFVEALAKVLEQNSTFIELDLSKKHIGDAGAAALARALEHNSTLTKIDLSKNQIGDEGATALAHALRGNSTVTKVHLNKNQISHVGATALVTAFEDHPTLKELHLNDNQIDEVTMTRIMKITICRKFEEDSDFAGIDVSESEWAELWEELEKKALEHNTSVFQLLTNEDEEEGGSLFMEALPNSAFLKFLWKIMEKTFDLDDLDLTESERDELRLAFMSGFEKKALERNISPYKLVEDEEDEVLSQPFIQALPKHSLLRLFKKTLEKHFKKDSFDDLGVSYEDSIKNKKRPFLTKFGLNEGEIDEYWLTFETVLEERALEQNTSVEEMIVDNMDNEDFARALVFDGLVRFLEQNTTLTILNLDHRKIDGERVKVLGTVLGQNSTLTKLSLNGNRICTIGVAAIGAGLANNSALSTLCLDGNKLGNEGIISLARSLEDNNSLTRLAVGGNKIEDDGTIAIAKVLQQNSTLNELNLSFNKIREAGATALAKSLKHNATLTGLHLLGNDIGDAGAKEFAKTFKYNTTLIELSLKRRRTFPVEPTLQSYSEKIKNALSRNKKLKEEKDPPSTEVSSKGAEKNIEASSSSRFVELEHTSTSSSEAAMEFIYDRVSYQRQFITLGDGACGLHALVGKRVNGEYIWNPKGLDLFRTAEIQKEAKAAFNNAIRPILTRDQSYLRNLLHHSMEERLTETVEFKAWNAPFEEQFKHFSEELLSLLTIGFYWRIQERVVLIFQKTPKEYLKLIEAIKNAQSISESFCNCINANFEEFKQLDLEDSTWERIIGLRELKQGIEQIREQALHAFIDSHFELYSTIIEDSDCYLSVDELKLAAELLQPDNKVLIFYHRDIPPYVVNPAAVGEIIAIEHSIVYHPNGRHFSRLEAVKHS